MEHRFPESYNQTNASLVITFAISFLPVIGTLGILIAALVTLCKGLTEGFVFTIVAVLPYVIGVFFPGKTPDVILPIIILGIVGWVASGLFTWLFAAILYRKGTFKTILQYGALLGILVVSVVHIIYPKIDAWWQVQLTAYLHYANQVMAATTGGDLVPNPSQIVFIDSIKYYATGLAVMTILANALVQIGIARWWQIVGWWQIVVLNSSLNYSKPGTFRSELVSIRLDYLAGIFFAGGVLIFYIGNQVASDVLPILYFSFFMAGLSLIHYVLAFIKTGSLFWVIMIYAAIVWLFPISLMLVALIAFIDVLVDVRKYVKQN